VSQARTTPRSRKTKCWRGALSNPVASDIGEELPASLYSASPKCCCFGCGALIFDAKNKIACQREGAGWGILMGVMEGEVEVGGSTYYGGAHLQIVIQMVEATPEALVYARVISLISSL